MRTAGVQHLTEGGVHRSQEGTSDEAEVFAAKRKMTEGGGMRGEMVSSVVQGHQAQPGSLDCATGVRCANEEL